MDQRRRTRISEEEWGEHKETIRDLFLKQNNPLLGEDGLMSIMEREHSFFARYVAMSCIDLFELIVSTNMFLTASLSTRQSSRSGDS
jgi:hypothetical protein